MAERKRRKRSPEVIARMVEKCRATKRKTARKKKKVDLWYQRQLAAAKRQQFYANRTDVGVVESRRRFNGHKVLCALSLHGRKIAELPVVPDLSISPTVDSEHAVRRYLWALLTSADWGPQEGRATARSEAIARKSVQAVDALIAQATASQRRAATTRKELSALDIVLDKISRQGIDSLTDDERSVLDAESQKRRAA